MRKILLMGNPNVGKSVVFSRLTGAKAVASNYPGTTVDFTVGKMYMDGEKVKVVDVPGTYSLEPTNKAEEVAAEMLEEGDLVINVVDSTNLERNLFLTLELLEREIPVVVALNLSDEAKHKGIEIDSEKLEELLGVPVVPTVALTGEGVKKLVSRLKDSENPEKEHLTEDERWAEIGSITRKVEKIRHSHHTFKERLSDFTVKPGTGIPIAAGVILASFWLVRFIGEKLIAYVFEPIFNLYSPLAMRLSSLLSGYPIIHDVLIGKLVDGEIVWVESMGLLTTGIFVPFAMVLPYIIGFYFMLTLLEDTGYLPRLGTLMDNFFHRLGMHGYGIVPVFLGLGCNVPGALSIRIFETRKQRFISATLMCISVPCMAQTAMIFGVIGGHGITPLLIVFISLAMIYTVFGLILNKFVEGMSPEIFLEIPPYRRPSGRTVIKKVWTRVRWFLGEALPWLFLGIVFINLLYSFGLLTKLGKLAAPLMEGWFGLPGEASLALLIGFLRKDLAVGMLLGVPEISVMQLVIAVIVLTIYFPCVATFAVLAKELGWKDMIKSTFIMVGVAFLVGGVLRIILLGG
ncbi:iron transporter FeoB [candidate division MSBL1 archaeon SCGC-AAA382A20]|uniref:Iron transporter FeoB n=1 Tax=candidate division MSBL1 archaeon SCGC-AAA382A20 TaxID=1698280 RepID=A0A133VJZ1_9EURY|nr:iron transporter FeoB [candidate division MSBL1 archaeon SCGC-AAA382A20]